MSIKDVISDAVDEKWASPNRETKWINVHDALPSAGEFTFCPIGVNKFVAAPEGGNGATWENDECQVVNPTHWAPLFRGPN